MWTGIITILIGVIVGWVGGQFFHGLIARLLGIAGTVITIIGIVQLVLAFI